jgi:hypothetical protein
VRRRKNVTVRRKNVAGRRRNVAVRRKNVVGSRKNVAVRRKNVPVRRKNVAVRRKNVVGSRKNVAVRRKNVVGSRRNVAERRKNVSGRRKNVPSPWTQPLFTPYSSPVTRHQPIHHCIFNWIAVIILTDIDPFKLKGFIKGDSFFVGLPDFQEDLLYLVRFSAVQHKEQELFTDAFFFVVFCHRQVVKLYLFADEPEDNIPCHLPGNGIFSHIKITDIMSQLIGKEFFFPGVLKLLVFDSGNGFDVTGLRFPDSNPGMCCHVL